MDLSTFILWFLIIVSFYYIVARPYLYKQGNKTSDYIPIIQEKLEESIEASVRETELINSGKIPTDEDINLYYKMYLKKWEIDHAANDEWETDIITPMDFAEWEERAKEKSEIGGYKFIIPRTMDMMIGFPPNVQFVRYNDYRQMVKDDERNK